MRTKVTTKQVRSPVAALNAQLFKAKLDDLDDYLDAIKTSVYVEAGAISPTDGLALIDAAVPHQAMTLANGAVVGEKIIFKLRGRETVAAVDPVADTLTIDAHSFDDGDGPYYVESTTRDLPVGLSSRRQYWTIDESAFQVKLALSEEDANDGVAVDLQSEGSGTISLVKAYAVESVTHGSENLEITGHDITTGDEVLFTVAGTAPAGLENGTTYFAIVVDGDNIQLAETLEDAEAETPVTFTTNGSGDIVLRRVVAEIASVTTSARITPATMPGGTYIDLDATDDRGALIWTAGGWAAKVTGSVVGGGEFVSVAHGMSTGGDQLFIAASVTLPTPFVALTPYWPIVVSADRFQLAASEEDANNGVPINVTGVGAGTITLSRVTDVEIVEDVAGVIAALDLDDVTANVDTIIEAETALGVAGHAIRLAFVADGTGAGSFTRSSNDLTFHYESGVTTVTNFQSAVAALGGADDLIAVRTAGTGANIFTAPGDTMALTALAGGVDAVDLLHATAHAIPDEATMRIMAPVGGVIPTGLAALTTYYAIVGGDPDSLELATSQPNAAAGTEINITTEGTLPLKLYQVGYKTISAIDPVTP